MVFWKASLNAVSTDTTIILAAGHAARWSGPVPKTMVPVYGGEPLLFRTVRLCAEAGRTPLVVVDPSDDAILAAPPGLLTIPGGATTCASLLNTASQWTNGARVHVLLADVLYSHWAWSWLFQPRDDIWFLGTPSEIHALGFYRDQYASVEAALRVVIDFAARRKLPHLGRLWGLYRQLTASPLDRHTETGRYFTTAPMNCESLDFDHYEDWLTWRRENNLPTP